jgi:pimeloyl-ACP methyl ester carboxylesterase
MKPLNAWFAGLIAASSVALMAAAPDVPRAIYTDPPVDPHHPASGMGIQFESHGALINAQIYRPPGDGPHPTVLLSHGLPGNEQNLDLAQVMRRAGWTVVTYHFRGSWGSGGTYSLKNGVEDAEAILAQLKDPARAAELGVDPKHIVVMGHSYGGYVSGRAAAETTGVEAVALIAPWEPSIDRRAWIALDRAKRDATIATTFDDASGRLGAVTVRDLSDEIMRDGAGMNLVQFTPRLAKLPVYIAVAKHDDPDDQAADLIAALKATRSHRLTLSHMDTDHPFSDHRIALESEVLRWLAKLPGAPPLK